jgi:hypothetical protein
VEAEEEEAVGGAAGRAGEDARERGEGKAGGEGL